VIRLRSTIAANNGPLTVLPTNICAQYPNIASLDLSYNSIAGFLNTTQLACLDAGLVHIDMSHNSIADADQHFFRANQALQTIDLSYNLLIKMPIVSQSIFVDFPKTIISMDFSFNQITNVDLWPLFVKTGMFIEVNGVSDTLLVVSFQRKTNGH
jgi:hypothetical protein